MGSIHFIMRFTFYNDIHGYLVVRYTEMSTIVGSVIVRSYCIQQKKVVDLTV